MAGPDRAKTGSNDKALPEGASPDASPDAPKKAPPRLWDEKDDARRLLGYLRPHAKTLALAVLSMGLAALSTAGMAWLIKPLLDHVFFERDLSLLNSLTILTLTVYGSTGVFSFFQSYFMNKVGYTIVNEIRVGLYSHVERQSLSFFHRNPSGELISRVVNDVSLVQNSVTQVVTGLVMDVCKVVGLITVLILRDPVLALCGVVALPVAIWPIARFGRRLRRLATGSQLIMGSLITVLTETFQGVRVVQSHNREDHEIARFAKECRRNVDNLMRAVTVRSLSSSVMEILGGVCVAAVIWYGGREVIAGRSTPGTFFSFMTALLLLYEPLKRLTRLHNEAQTGLSAARRIFGALDTPIGVSSPAEPAAHPERLSGGIEFRDVTFSYEPGREALSHVSLVVPRGETLALVGPSGGGKTSLANLLSRFYDPVSGSVLIDGIDIKTLELSFLRSQVAMVGQDTWLFDASVRDNIAYGKPDAGISEIEAAARASLSDGFIGALPKGYDEPIGERGGKLSGGQRQRLAIARAILKDSPVLVLDEATSSLDAESEKQVQKALENLSRGRTTLVIAHRLSTVRNASRIAVIKGGRVVEEGSHQGLLQKGGEYARLHALQFAIQEEASGGIDGDGDWGGGGDYGEPGPSEDVGEKHGEPGQPGNVGEKHGESDTIGDAYVNPRKPLDGGPS
ncbi:MAG: ABC transporter ATP-binding protein/permease [Deltaproteobacteria bacterium]|nr:ABC transporter ATP-binding protein/permease [Deltaproteobacteria bacterium]